MISWICATQESFEVHTEHSMTSYQWRKKHTNFPNQMQLNSKWTQMSNNGLKSQLAAHTFMVHQKLYLLLSIIYYQVKFTPTKTDVLLSIWMSLAVKIITMAVKNNSCSVYLITMIKSDLCCLYQTCSKYSFM